MKKILVISYPYQPRHMASSICLESILRELSKEYSIDLITLNEKPYLAEYEIIDSIHVFRVMSCFKLFNNRLVKKVQLKINNMLRPYFWMDDGIYWMRKAYKKSLQLIEKNNYDYILSSSGTFSTQNIAMKIKNKHPHIKWISYVVDPFPIDNPRVNRTHFYNAKNLSIRAVKLADGIAILPNLFEKYCDELLSKYKRKCVKVDIPLLNRLNVQNERSNKDVVDLLFVGSLSREIRNPEYLLALILKVNEKKYIKRLRLTIFGGQRDCKDILNKYKELLGENLIINDYVPREVVLDAMSKASILVNIGNSSPHMVPSKIFEYMGTGLPIINIENIENDSSELYLKKYGLALSLKSNWSKLDENSNDLYEFCDKYQIARKPYDEVEELFIENTSNFVTNKIKKMMGPM